MVRKSINIATLDKIKNFLKNKEPIYKIHISKKLGIDFYSLKIALDRLDIKTNEKGQVSLK